MAAAVVTLLFVGAAAETIVSRTVRGAFVEEQLADQRADAASIARAMAQADDGEEPVDEAQELVDVIAARPSVAGVELVDVDGRVVAAADRTQIGEVEQGPIVEVARTGRASAGAETEAHESGADLEYRVPLEAAGRRLALETDQPRRVLDARITAVRRQLVTLGLVGLPVALVVFFLVGGRHLTRRHASAVERSLTDALTGLGNHSAFYEAAEREAALANRHRHDLTLAVIDIDDFKFCNDRLGHDYGDRVLRGIASALAAGRRGDACFRLGGDEFAVLLPHTDLLGARVALESAVERANASLPGIHLSIGVSVLSSAGGDVALLREQADVAGYEAKRTTASVIVIFDEISSSATLAHPERVRALGDLIEHGELDVAFQPIWDLDRNEVLGYEALARPSAQFGFKGPGELFELAEKVGNAHQLCEIARRSALRCAGDLPPRTLLFLNVSPKSLERNMLAGTTLVDAVGSAGLAPHQIVLELTEHVTTRLRHVVREISRLRSLGFKIALDDVGAGNAGLELLCSVGVDFVKIDRSVVSSAPDDASALGVLEAVIAYATRTGATVIAEGIENETQLALVREPATADHAPRHSVRAGQGFLLGRPASDFADAAALSH
ncbi:MAG: diguanylate cyclase/phosphodiesterase (GGDEF & EAL domains) with PAS/PAC sensor(s) [uncultured Solirubrobacteraceae bacterium]|uniref:Diguanylate cyclase/phosphodiesterase (GGDEF & EAL domains) with PAS/PAC sensor(S) n=1 Tax=uncultured Solirubrobacteraceae bacterium TaxID=1162706 RepID=A0A6J4SR65_9ACTN|nr:MAG: diguanylate cyclase/phosphodiesterase (GGDEF & EAL domains) with PAS/PAC sensor(s) [uncultured Solirubrobacteraceae bacterium]